MNEIVNGVEIGVIGGSGLYNLEQFQVLGEVQIETPWGKPSDSIVISQTTTGTPIKVAFLARHCRGHTLSPSEVNSRANIAALKHIGVKVILSFSAVGSLREEIAPRHFAVPSQIIDRTKGVRQGTFFENGVIAHVPFADPFDEEISQLIQSVAATACPTTKFHFGGTLVCMEGPAFSTRAESHLYRSWGADLINMSAVPEAKLAREAEIVYSMICMATDYDCWKDHEESVTVDAVIQNLSSNAENAKNLLTLLIPALHSELHSLQSVKRAVDSAVFSVITAKDKRNPDQIKKLKFILPSIS